VSRIETKIFNTGNTEVHRVDLDAEIGLFQLGEHGFHFALRVEVAGAAGGSDAVGEHGFSVGDSIGAGQRLGGHEISGSIVGSGFEQDGEFGERAVEVALFGIFHCQSVAGEGVVGILGEDVVEGGDAVHRQWSVASDQWPAQTEVTT
jgi:hypothetical protein